MNQQTGQIIKSMAQRVVKEGVIVKHGLWCESLLTLLSYSCFPLAMPHIVLSL